MPPVAEFSRTHAYVRQARRLRGSLAGRPEKLYRSLRQLSDRQDQQFSLVDSLEHRRGNLPIPSPGTSGTSASGSQAHVDEFASYVASQLEGQVLRYSLRLKLLNDANRLGIGRFHANLLIAAVEHQQGLVAPVSAPRRVQGKALLPLAVFVATQCIILLLAWSLLLR
jgi:hypothetical protein